MSGGPLVCAGDRLATTEQYAPGQGVYVRGGFVCASIVGHQTTEQRADADGGAKPLLHVLSTSSLPLVPKPGDVVTVKISRVAQTSASCTIMCVGARALEQEFKGTIRQQDVRATEIDKVVMYDCFRPGDIVRAEVLSLGDARSYHLSSAKNELGVVYARSAATGAPMVPVSWSEMQCPETQAVEKRKVAKSAQ